ncbi:MAG: S-methyl-5-thioribose-1-phosphate isomerase [Candidatus Bathyarchaeia archaeon]|nr:S-methyl-5-thioribose-1-phosphate isomerase [Candidatus Bathyarchaeota archaeon]
MEDVFEVANKIKRLEIQGARNIAIAAIKAIEAAAIKTKAKNKDEILKELYEARDVLFKSRVTEPLMRNAVRRIIAQLEETHEDNVGVLREVISLTANQFLEDFDRSGRLIAEIGSKRIRDGMVVFTHCHSSTVTNILKKAREEGKTFEVICTETRPLFQGRITAKELVEAGIKTTLIVDSAARFFMNEVDMVIVGADAITSEGNIVNKIGTSAIALIAKEARTPFYVASELLKFDPETMYGDYEKIEERSPREVWDNPPEPLIIRNPAFDVTRRDFIHGIICEEGIISPHTIVEVVRRRYPWIFSSNLPRF